MVTGKMRPGSLAPKATIPWPPWASYLVRKIPPPPTARLRPLMMPFCPPALVVWVSWTFADIQESSPWAEIDRLPRLENHLQQRKGAPLDFGLHRSSLGSAGNPATGKCNCPTIVPDRPGANRDADAGDKGRRKPGGQAGQPSSSAARW